MKYIACNSRQAPATCGKKNATADKFPQTEIWHFQAAGKFLHSAGRKMQLQTSSRIVQEDICSLQTSSCTLQEEKCSCKQAPAVCKKKNARESYLTNEKAILTFNF
jgi:hypothetical protein